MVMGKVESAIENFVWIPHLEPAMAVLCMTLVKNKYTQLMTKSTLLTV
jgi:hypothetical protein